VLRQAAAEAGAAHNDLGQSYALGYLGLIEADRSRADDADRLGLEAVTLSDAPGFAEHFVLMVGHLARGRAAKLAGRLAHADDEIRRAVELSGRGAGRLEVAACNLAQARIRHLRGDSDGARSALRAARAVIDECAEPGTLGPAIAAGERGLRLAARTGEPSVGEELTERELAVLRLLASDLSRREIAEALYVSPNTVKTHAKGIYRKLDAATREEAVTRARELDLL
jgi:LuxR family transcriptional regulator, maltose regulon positive regulatory protein